jgi:Iap family predicted aminopeptidase
LCDYFGARPSGSPQLAAAIRWAAEQMRKDGLEKVSTPAVTVEHWVRGRESLVVLSPVKRPLPVLGLGLSVGTPADGIAAEVVVVSSFEELDRLGSAGVAGKIVLFNAPFVSYDKTVRVRADGPSKAAQLGAVAVLVRSVGSASLRTPHTGALRYDLKVAKIPAAAVTWEDAMMIDRFVKRGESVRVRLSMEAHMEAPAQSANVIGEITGREKPDDVVVVGGHIDSWDVGQGAQDDGSGSMAALQAVHLIRKLGLKPRRTIRVVLWTNEESGLAGGKAYAAMPGVSAANHVAAIEMDGGGEAPVAFETTAKGAGIGVLEQIVPLLSGLGVTKILPVEHSEADIDPLVKAGVPGLGLRTTTAHYFDWHHTEADTVDKVNPEDFRKNVAALAVMTYVLADMPGTLGGR